MSTGPLTRGSDGRRGVLPPAGAVVRATRDLGLDPALFLAAVAAGHGDLDMSATYLEH